MTINELEECLLDSVTDHRRLILESLQMESYLFSPGGENTPESKYNDWQLRLENLGKDYNLCQIVREERQEVLDQANA